MSDLELDIMKAKLLWAANGDWSVPVSPKEARLLLDTIYPEKPTGTVDKRQSYFGRSAVESERSRQVAENARLSRITEAKVKKIKPYIGDPGDEHHE